MARHSAVLNLLTSHLSKDVSTLVVRFVCEVNFDVVADPSSCADQALPVVAWRGEFSHGFYSPHNNEVYLWLTLLGGASFGHCKYKIDRMQHGQEEMDNKHAMFLYGYDDDNCMFATSIYSSILELWDLVHENKVLPEYFHKEDIEIDLPGRHREDAFYCKFDTYRRDYWENPTYFYIADLEGLRNELEGVQSFCKYLNVMDVTEEESAEQHCAEPYVQCV